jgi:hypothetical protein
MLAASSMLAVALYILVVVVVVVDFCDGFLVDPLELELELGL